MAFIRDRFSRHAMQQTESIYIKRSGTVRTLVNEAALISALLLRNFQIIDPGEMSLQEQIDIFSRARTIIGPTGAAMTNLLFSGKGTRVLVFAADHPQTNLGIFGQIGQFNRLKMQFMLCARMFESMGRYSVHDLFSANVGRVVEWCDGEQ